eukprot:5014194-Prymnesium_polylepis.1
METPFGRDPRAELEQGLGESGARGVAASPPQPRAPVAHALVPRPARLQLYDGLHQLSDKVRRSSDPASNLTPRGHPCAHHPRPTGARRADARPQGAAFGARGRPCTAFVAAAPLCGPQPAFTDHHTRRASIVSFCVGGSARSAVEPLRCGSTSGSTRHAGRMWRTVVYRIRGRVVAPRRLASMA